MAMDFIPLRRIADDQLGFGALVQAPTNWGEVACLNAAQINSGAYGVNYLVSFEGYCYGVAPEVFAQDFEVIEPE